MDDNLVSQFADEIDPDEKILWCGRPFSGIHFDLNDFKHVIPNHIVPFIILFILLVYFNMIITLTDLGIAILIICIFIFPLLIELVNILVVEPIIRKNTTYSISNQRIIIKSKLDASANESINLNSIKGISLLLYNNGKGTIRLGNDDKTTWIERNRITKFFLLRRKYRGSKLELIDDVLKVYDLIKKLQWEKIIMYSNTTRESK